ncbi:MAG: rhodanese-like domain-containing protein [Limisphaerales bacterium]
MTLTAASTLADVLAAYPGARRALFREYHLGGCSSCAFSPDETLAALCARNGGLNPAEVLAHLSRSHEGDLTLLVEPHALAEELKSPAPPRLLDLRSREDWEAARVPGSEVFTQEHMQEILGRWDRAQPFVLVDHAGREGLDAAAYFAGHGFTAVRALRGGVDAWSREVDPAVPRYRLE